MVLKKMYFPLMGFASTTTYLVGVITLLVYLDEGRKTPMISVTFIIVDPPSLYNAILGWSTVNINQMVHYTYYQIMKFLMPHGIGVVNRDQPIARSFCDHFVRCHMLKKKKK